MLYEARDDGKVDCRLCSHRCRIADDKFGKCRVRQNREGKLFTHAYGVSIAARVDPIEKKPLYHFLPGSLSFSVATMGCNFQCGFCQNWQISQSLKGGGRLSGTPLPPKDIVSGAIEQGCLSIAYTYTEPTIFFEYAYDTARLAKESGLHNVFVTNGYMTAEALETIRPYLDGCNVDLKAFNTAFYKETCAGSLEPVLDSIRLMKELDIWVEVTTLIIPGVNDSRSELGDIARFIAEVDMDIPWHISRFHPDYEFSETASTPMETMEMALSVGKQAGLRYIYMGNVGRGDVDTRCPNCTQMLIRRRMYTVKENRVADQSCPECGEPIVGVFGT